MRSEDNINLENMGCTTGVLEYTQFLDFNQIDLDLEVNLLSLFTSITLYTLQCLDINKVDESNSILLKKSNNIISKIVISIDENNSFHDFFISISNLLNRSIVDNVSTEQYNFASKIPTIVSLNDYSCFVNATGDKNNSTLLIKLVKVESDLRVKLYYNCKIYDSVFITAVLNSIRNCWNSVLIEPHIKLSNIELISIEEKQVIQAFSLGEEIQFDETLSLLDLFNLQVEKFPERIAVQFQNKQLTYKELDNASNSIANLIKTKGIAKGDFVCLMVNRSCEMIVAILAILKVGAVYIPLNPRDPATRVNQILVDSQASFIIRTKDTPQILSFKGIEIIIDITEIEYTKFEYLNNVEANDLAYIIYTSGTTGIPKGSRITHKNITNLIVGLNNIIYKYYSFPLNVACIAPYYFDASVQQIFASLILGNKLIIAPECAITSSEALYNFYLLNNINISDGTPTHISMLNDSIAPSDVKENLLHYIIGGDILHYSQVKSFFLNSCSENTKLTNIYGPTECCVDCISYTINKENVKSIKSIPIGKPLANQKVFILDKQNKILPIGIQGEICISGYNVGKGYLNRDNLNKEKFIINLLNNDEILYKTGDIGRWLPDGNIEYKGRDDTQVKIHGHRIELGEIENRLLTFNKKFSDANNNESIRTCPKCLMDSRCSEIKFSENSLCSDCNFYERHEKEILSYFKSGDDFKTLMNKASTSNAGKYDCLLLFSGGKDSTYVLYKLLEMNYKVLAFTFDNGYISDAALKHIKEVTFKLGVDSVIATSPAMDEVFLESLMKDSTVCTGCFKALTALSTKYAFDNNINVIITGLSRGQIMDTKLSSLFKDGLFDIDKIDRRLHQFRKIYHANNDRTACLLGVNFENEELFDQTYFVDYFRYFKISNEELLNYLVQNDTFWSKPSDTGLCSTNCKINDTGSYVHIRNKGYHNYMIPLSWSCRLGETTKDKAINQIKDDFSIEDITSNLNKINYSNIEKSQVIKEACAIVNKDSFGDSYISVYYTTDRKVEKSELRNYLSSQLPDYMIPSKFIELEKLPRTGNNKIDRNALSKIKQKRDNYYPANTILKKELVPIWEEVLGETDIGIYDNFFELGGQSIKAMKLASIIEKKFNVNISFNEVFKELTINNLAKYIENHQSNIKIEDQYHPELNQFQISYFQEGMYFSEFDNYGETDNIITVACLLRNFNDPHKVEESILKLVERHEALRTGFSIIDDKILQVISEKIDFKPTKVHIRESQLDNLIQSTIKCFDLTQAPLFRATIGIVDDTSIAVILNIHHIISDFRSIQIMLEEFVKFINGQEVDELKTTFKDYALYEKNSNNRFDMKQEGEYWKRVLLNYNNPFEIPKEYIKKINNFKLDKEIVSQLKDLGVKCNCSTYMILFTAFSIVVSKMYNQDDVVIGMPISLRDKEELHNIIGPVINTIAVRTNPQKNKSLLTYLHEVRNTLFDAYRNKHYPLTQIVKDLNLSGQVNKNPLYNVLFAMYDDKLKLQFKRVETETMLYTNNLPTMDLVAELIESPSEVLISFNYNASVVSENSINKLKNGFIEIVNAFAKRNNKEFEPLIGDIEY